jgi:hypothetical protein
MKMSCDLIRRLFDDSGNCKETPSGARVTTHCVYPSFDPVHVFVAKIGDEFRVHDAEGAFASAWIHGRDERLILSFLKAEVERYHLQLVDKAIVANVKSAEWLISAVIEVANASSMAARGAVDRIVSTQEDTLVTKIETVLAESFGRNRFDRDVEIRGASGGKRKFDFLLREDGDKTILINGVSPHPTSISSKYVAFADTEGDAAQKFAVFDRELDSEDAALLGQVASVVPLASLHAGAERTFTRGR